MGDAYRGLGLVDVLTARTGGAVRVDLQVLRPHLDLAFVLDLRRRIDESERCLPAALRVEGRYADETVGAALRAEIAVRVRAVDGERCAADAGLVPWRRLDDFRLVPMPLRPAEIHAH